MHKMCRLIVFVFGQRCADDPFRSGSIRHLQLRSVVLIVGSHPAQIVVACHPLYSTSGVREAKLMLLDVTRERPAVLPADRATLLVEHAAELATLGSSFGDGPRGGLWQGDPGLIHDGAVAIGGDGRILAVGPTARVRDVVDLAPKARVYDASGCAVVPGLFDAHAELVTPHSGDNPGRGSGAARRNRMGLPRDPLAEALSLSERDLVARFWRRLDAALVSGTTGLSVTSGYSLDPDDELRLLRAAQAMTDVGPVTVGAAFRAGGGIPAGSQRNPSEYIDLLSHELLPDIADDELATSLAFLADQSVLTLEQSWRLLRAAQTNGLHRRLELCAASHPTVLDLAADMGVGTVVLLDEPSDAAIGALADMPVTAIIPVGPAVVGGWGRRVSRRLIELGVPVALGTGQGTANGPAGTILDALRIACESFGLSSAEALVAATVNAAFASGAGDDVGSLEPGKRADLVILDVPSYSHLPYRGNADLIRAVVKDGWVVVEQGSRVA
jgi:imidazolonepropionase